MLQTKFLVQKAYGDSVLLKTRAYEGYKSFKEGHEIVEDIPRFGRPSTSTTENNINVVKGIIVENSHTSLRKIARDLNISYEAVRIILTEHLSMKRVAARFVPKELNFL